MTRNKVNGRLLLGLRLRANLKLEGGTSTGCVLREMGADHMEGIAQCDNRNSKDEGGSNWMNQQLADGRSDVHKRMSCDGSHD